DQSWDAAFFHHWYGSTLDAVGDVDGAEKEYRQAHEIRIQRLRDKPDDAGRKQELAHIKGYLAGLIRNAGRPAEAVELYEQAALLCEECLDQFPDNADFLRRTDATLGSLTEALADSGRIDDALVAQKRLMAFYDRAMRTEGNLEWVRRG